MPDAARERIAKPPAGTAYTFAPWKVAISGFYKNLKFHIVGPINGKPTMLDDTCYFLNCESEQEAKFLVKLLNSRPANSLLSSLVFWSDKRPITVELLKRLHIGKLAEHMGLEKEYEHFVHQRQRQKMPLFSDPNSTQQGAAA